MSTDAFYEEWDRFFLAFENALETCPKAEEETHHA